MRHHSIISHRNFGDEEKCWFPVTMTSHSMCRIAQSLSMPLPTQSNTLEGVQRPHGGREVRNSFDLSPPLRGGTGSPLGPVSLCPKREVVSSTTHPSWALLCLSPVPSTSSSFDTHTFPAEQQESPSVLAALFPHLD